MSQMYLMQPLYPLPPPDPGSWIWLQSQKQMPLAKVGKTRDKREQEYKAARLPEANKKTKKKYKVKGW